MHKQQIELAIKMNKSGISWDIISSYFGVSPKTLLKYRKQYK